MIKLQNIVYPSDQTCTEEALFFRKSRGCNYYPAKEYTMLSKDATISFDTYFNGLSIGKWLKYTKVKNIVLRLRLQGNFCITLLHTDTLLKEIFTQEIKQEYCNTNGKLIEIAIPYDCEKTQGMYTFRITALEDESCVYEGGYYTDISEKEVAYVKLGIIICTFRRESFVYNNISKLTKTLFHESSALRNGLKIYISDNANTLDCKQIESPHISVFQNKNVGGAGGFTRGMIEALKEQGEVNLTHVLLMDDDIVIQPESIFRTYALLSLIKEEYKDSYVGGAMLRLDKPWHQVESGAVWNTGNLISKKAGLDLRKRKECLYNEIEETCDYNAWWYCTIPIQFIRTDNLPLPIFIRGDDVEYGLRNMKRLILLNGICVWHEPFEAKYSSSMYYYIFRNRLINNAVRGIYYDKKVFLRDIRAWFLQELFTYRYKNAQLLLDGAYDFLKGITFLKEMDGEVLHKNVMQKGYAMQDVEQLELPFDLQQYEQTTSRLEGRAHQLVRKILLNGTFLKSNGNAVTSVTEPKILHCFRKEKVLNYDYVSKKGFVTKKDRKAFVRLCREYGRFHRHCLKVYDDAMLDYQKRKQEVMQIEFWKEYLHL
jgi:Predicted glycosyltransferases